MIPLMRNDASTLSRPDLIPSVNFAGVPIDALTYQDLFRMVDEWIKDKSGRSHHVACVNAYCVALSLRDRKLKRIFTGADIIGADGMPFVQWIRFVKGLKCDRFYAPAIILQLAAVAKQKGYTFYLFGGHPDVAARMEEYLLCNYPHLRIVGRYSPPFRPMTVQENEAVTAELNRLQPDIVCVGLGTPKQDFWIDEHLDTIKGAVFVASGATFDFFGGRIKMAPKVVQNLGLEWLYRLFSKDFTRLWKRYTYYHGIFVFAFLLQLLHIRTIPPQRWSRDSSSGPPANR